MELLLDDPTARTRQRAREFVERHVRPFAEEHDREQQVGRACLGALAEDGWLGADAPLEYGGGGLDPLAYGLVIEEFGRGCSSVRSLLTVHAMVSCAIARWGTQAQKDRFLPDLARGRCLAALAFSEEGSGTDLARVATRLEEAAGGHVLHGAKKWVTFGQLADWFLVLAGSAGGPVTVLVPRSAPGLLVRSLPGPLGTRGSMLAELELHACPVLPDQVLGRASFGLSFVGATALDHGRFTVAWGCVGLAEACLRAAAAHATRRTQFGAALAQHQLVRRLLSNMAASVRAARLLCMHAGKLRTAAHHDSVAETSVAKYFAADAAMTVSRDALQIHGATGCQPGHEVERHFRDAKIMEIIEGTSEMHQLLIADLPLADLGASS